MGRRVVAVLALRLVLPGLVIETWGKPVSTMTHGPKGLARPTPA